MADAMIDLGEVPRQREHLVPISRSLPLARYRPLLGALSLLLIALLAGAAHDNPPRAPAVIPGRLSDVTFVDGGRLFVISVGPAQPGRGQLSKIISGYSLPDAKLLSRTTVVVSGSVSTVLLAGDTMVVSYRVDENGGQATVAVTVGTSTVLWRRPVELFAVSAADGIALLGLDNVGGRDAGWSVVDLKTGVARWSMRQPPVGFSSDVSFPKWFVTATPAGRLEQRDSRTGAITATATVPRSGSGSNGGELISSVDDLLMVSSRRGELTAYGLPGLVPRWTSEVDLSQSWQQSGCGPVICAFRQQAGVTALDRATGRPLWTSDRWTNVMPIGRYLAATPGDQSGAPPRLWLLDPATGRVLGDFGPWSGLGGDGESSLRYAMYQENYVVRYGELDPDRLRVRILGSAKQVSGDCHVSTGALICRLVDASIGVWRLE